LKAVGIVFSFANAGMAALNTVGFSESMIALLKSQDLSIIDGAQNDNRIISCIAIIVLQTIIVVGLEWEAKVTTITIYHSNKPPTMRVFSESKNRLFFYCNRLRWDFL